MKRENLIMFLLSVSLAAVSAIFGLTLKINDKTSDTRERLARIEAKVENLEARYIAKVK